MGASDVCDHCGIFFHSCVCSVCGLSKKVSLRVLCVSPAANKRVLVHASLLHLLLVLHVQACIAVQCTLSLAAG